MAFYKLNNRGLQVAPTSVEAPTFSLYADQKDTYTYPVGGWYWFDTEAQAYDFFELNASRPNSAITLFALRRRFTALERRGFELSMRDLTTDTTVARNKAAALRADWKDLEAMPFIVLNRPALRAIITGFETDGYIAVGRALVVLDDPIQDFERPLAG